MPLFHATLRTNLPSILKHGLGGGSFKKLWEGCEPGVYLAADPYHCYFVMIEHMMEFADPEIKPSDYLKNVCIIVIDDTRFDRTKMKIDPLIPKVGVYRYAGVIDVNGLPVLSIDDIFLKDDQTKVPVDVTS